MRILIAPNAFKNSLPAADVAAAIQKGLQLSALPCDTICFPVGDGGDGTAQLLTTHLKGSSVICNVHDPLGRIIEAAFGLTPDKKTAIIEMADASGLRLLQPAEYNPLRATSYGTGELIKAALDYKVEEIILCIGGSATVDGGTGILEALGVRLYGADGNELKDLPASLASLARIDLQQLDSRLMNTAITVLCDVENELLGREGAARVFGGQKGASESDIEKLEAAMQHLCNIVFSKTGKDMSLVQMGGAAGGVAAALHAFFGAVLVNGIEYFLKITDFEKQLEHTAMVITGEGSIDAQTLQGKGPFGIAKKAKEYGLPVIGIAGAVPLITDEKLKPYFDVLLPISNEAMDMATAIEYTRGNLVRSGKMLGDLLALKDK